MEGGAAVRALLLAVRLLAGGLFVYAGAMKVFETPQFAIDISHYRILPIDAAVVLAVYLPWVEIVAGSAVMLRRWYAGALIVLLTLTAVFMAVITSAAARGLDVECGCFGGGSGGSSPAWALARDAVLLAALVFLAIRDRRAGSIGG